MCAFNRKDVNILVYVYNRLLTICCLILIISCNKQPVSAQQRVSLEDAINNYVFNTSIVKKSKLKYNNIKLEYDNYKKSFFPAIGVMLTPISFNRNMTLLQNYMTGEYSNVVEYSNTTHGSLYITQKVMPTGGVFRVSSSLNYLRQFSSNTNSFSSTPLYMSYSQSLFGGNKTEKFQKTLNNLRMQVAYKNLCTSISTEQQTILNLYIASYCKMLDVSFYTQKVRISRELVDVATKKREMGRITEFDFNQVKLQMLEDEMNLQNSQHTYKTSLRNLAMELCFEDIQIDSLNIDYLPKAIDENIVCGYIQKNNPEIQNLELRRISADYERYTARLGTRFNADVSLSFGLNQYANTLADAYKTPDKQQSVGITLNIPVFQWGINKNKRKIAENKYEETVIDIEDAKKRFQSQIREYIFDYNNSVCLLAIAKLKYDLALQQYEFTSVKYNTGKISSIDLTTANKDCLSAKQEYISTITSLYVNYYHIRHISLHDFVSNKDLMDLFNDKI